MDGVPLKIVGEFTYLGSTLSRDGDLDIEIQQRVAKASSAFGRLRARLWNNHHVTIKIKCQIYQAVILTALLYGTESWAIKQKHVKRLHAIQMRHLRSIMGLRWTDKVTNIEILKRAGLPSMENQLTRRNLRWAGHVAHMGDERLPKQIIFSQLKEGKRDQGRPKLRYKDVIKRNLRKRNIPTTSWFDTAQDRNNWRRACQEKFIVESTNS